MTLQNMMRRLDRLDALTNDTGLVHYIWRESGETTEQAIERTGMRGRNVVVIGWLDSPSCTEGATTSVEDAVTR